MGDSNNQPLAKLKRLYFKTYVQLIKNSVGSDLFRNFYVEDLKQGEFDALDDGVNSCAFFVSAVLKIFGKLSAVHGTVDNTIKDLEESGWEEVCAPKPGDVIVWEAQKFEDGYKQHIGFSIGDGKAISNSWKKRTPIEHDQSFEGSRKISQVFRFTNWD